MQNYPFIFKIKNNYLLKKELLKNYTNLILFPYSKTVEDLIKFNNFLVRDIDLPENVECFLDPRVPVVGMIKIK